MQYCADEQNIVFENKCGALGQFIRTLSIIFLCLWVSDLHAQDTFNTIDIKQIKQKKVRQFVRKQQKEEIVYFSELETSVNNQDELDGFLNFEKEFIIKEESDLVWGNYQYSSQTEVWDLNKISFAFLFNRNTESIVYADQDYFGLEKGQIFYLNLKILNGFYNIPVAFEVIEVDPENKLIEFSYLKGGKAEGKQSIRLEQAENGTTRIIHQSFVKSNSKIRDKYLYPYFHNKLIREFHSNMNKMIVRKSKASGNDLAEVKK